MLTRMDGDDFGEVVASILCAVSATASRTARTPLCGEVATSEASSVPTRCVNSP